MKRLILTEKGKEFMEKECTLSTEQYMVRGSSEIGYEVTYLDWFNEFEDMAYMYHALNNR
jgi:hypothetical protein